MLAYNESTPGGEVDTAAEVYLVALMWSVQTMSTIGRHPNLGRSCWCAERLREAQQPCRVRGTVMLHLSKNVCTLTALHTPA